MKPKIICEIGCNHKGDIKIAKKMIEVAKEFCNVDVIKFQKDVTLSFFQSRNTINLILFLITPMDQPMVNIENS